MLPVAASSGFVAPIVWRVALIAPLPSNTAAMIGDDVMYWTRPLKNGFAVVLGVVLLRERGADLEHADGDDLQAAALQPRDHLAGEAALHRVGLNQYERPFQG